MLNYIKVWESGWISGIDGQNLYIEVFMGKCHNCKKFRLAILLEIVSCKYLWGHGSWTKQIYS